MAGTAEVHLFAAARAAVGSPQVEVPAGSLGAILAGLEAAHPEFAGVRPRCSYLLDGLAVHGDPADIAVAAGSRIDVLPPFAGG